MNAENWNRARSNFNHNWLKNRLIVTLSRTRNVLNGKVHDEAIWADLTALLSEWPERMAEAKDIMMSYPDAASPRQSVETSLAANVPKDVAGWLADVAVQRWKEQESPNEKYADAVGALNDLDSHMREFNVLLSSSVAPLDEGDTCALERLLLAANHLGKAMSTLGRLQG
ncbi:MAG: hypothetical protein IPG66_16380 [Hydrogenophilales bacterium]|nr:hypothetical protein [Hydrogenophilales bacterium]